MKKNANGTERNYMSTKEENCYILRL